LDIIIPEALQARHWEGYRRVMATGESRYSAGGILAVPGVRQDGSRISLEFTIVPMRDSAGQLTGFVAVLRDVTRRFEEIRTLKRAIASARFLRLCRRADLARTDRSHPAVHSDRHSFSRNGKSG
jgi:hypothetical protein